MGVGISEVGGSPANDGELRRALLPILPRLRRFCLSLAGSVDRGDDLAQAAIARALAAERRFEPGTRLDSWMFRIARNLHIDNQRRLKTRGAEMDVDMVAELAGDDGRAIVEGRSDLDRVRAAFETLPEEQRVMMNLIIVDGRSYKDAAEMLDIPIGTVMSRLSRARRALAQAVAVDGEGL